MTEVGPSPRRAAARGAAMTAPARSPRGAAARGAAMSALWRAARVAVALAGAVLAATACERAPGAAPAPAAPPRPLIVASFYPLYEFARQVAGERAEVTMLVPAGVEPHEWEPSPQDVARLQRAALI